MPEVTQPWSSHLLGGGEWKANGDLEDGEEISQQFMGNALWSRYMHFFQLFELMSLCLEMWEERAGFQGFIACHLLQRVDILE